MADVMNALEIAVSAGEYLAGDRFSAADVYVGSSVGWGMQFGMLETRPALERYVARVTARPAARRAKEIDDALAPTAR
jgi:glutathione S-transferase